MNTFFISACSPPIPNPPLSKERKVTTLVPPQANRSTFLTSLAAPLLAAFLALSPLHCTPVSWVQVGEVHKGAALFQKACIGCHDGGGNFLQPGATLFTKDLQRNGVATEDDIYNLTYYGKGRMPGFGEKCAPRGQCTFGDRLHDDEIKLLAEFVKSQADRDWTNIDPTD
ncbi:cytochrome c6, chloroplastic [Amborella trichopoda]|uniref:cytochrome c6, chloroplastic n=1 Tax=Amborella trichopoda TaxID=13333 RepID=UPI0009BCED07|nr:cytochrome c6, chloroplastic [Amborella trichopoda]|eukprot:XP_006853442.3 cytochrome c6, chloroplastic [Amborella trichopoda]